MNITKCKCCPNSVDIGKHIYIELHNWRNFFLELMLTIATNSERTPDTDEMVIATRSELAIGLWMVRIRIHRVRTRPAMEDEDMEFDDREVLSSNNASLYWVPPAPWQHDPGFGILGMSLSLGFNMFTCDADYDACIMMGYTFGLPYMGMVGGHVLWQPEYMRAKETR